MTWFGIKWLKKGWYAVKQDNQPTNQPTNLRVRKAWVGIYRLSTTWKFYLTEKKTGILSNWSRVSTTVWVHHLGSYIALEEKDR